MKMQATEVVYDGDSKSLETIATSLEFIANVISMQSFYYGAGTFYAYVVTLFRLL